MWVSHPILVLTVFTADLFTRQEQDTGGLVVVVVVEVVVVVVVGGALATRNEQRMKLKGYRELPRANACQRPEKRPALCGWPLTVIPILFIPGGICPLPHR